MFNILRQGSIGKIQYFIELQNPFLNQLNQPYTLSLTPYSVLNEIKLFEYWV